MLSPLLLNQQPNKAVEDNYSNHILYRFLTFVCNPIMTEAKEYAIYPGELFYNCIYSLDSLKGISDAEAQEKCRTMLDEIYRYFNDKGLNKSKPDVEHAICLLMYSVERCLALTEPPTYILPIGLIDMRLYSVNPDYINTLKRRFNRAVKTIGEQSLKDCIRSYMQSPELLSNEIGELIDANAIEPEQTLQSSRKKQKQEFQQDIAYMTFQKNGILDGHLSLLCLKLGEVGWIPKNTNPDDFCSLFSGKTNNVKITWTGVAGKGALVQLFRVLKKQKKILVPKSYHLVPILEAHFVDMDGKYLTKLNNSKYSDKYTSIILECFNQLQIPINSD